VPALAALVLASAGCFGDTGGALRFGLSAAPQNLDPRLATDAASTRVNRLLYARLVDFDERFQPVPALATWQRLSPTHYRFRLRRDRRPFHDGSPVRARDVVATYRAVLDFATGSPHRGSLHMIAAVTALDEDTVDFTLHVPDPLFPGRLVVGILPAALIQSRHAFNSRPLGSGPFRFLSWPRPGQLLVQRLRDGALVQFQRVQKPDVRVLKLLRGELDALQGDLPPELLGWVSRRDDVRVLEREGTTFSYLGFNMLDPLTGDPRVRRAVAHALDRQSIIRHLWAGNAREAAGILGPEHWAGHPGLRAPAHDPVTARRLLAEAGYGRDRELRLVYKTSTNPLRVRIATVIQHQLAEVGMTVELRTYDWGTFYGDIKAGNFQLYSLAWVGIKMPDIFRYVFHSESVPPAGANRGRWSDPEVDRLIEAAEAAPDTQRQARAYREVQERVLAALPYVPLWYENQVFVSRPGVRGYRVSRDGNYDGLVAAHWGATAPGASR
jgi:peptide/nickel transport system substrate-binding protein